MFPFAVTVETNGLSLPSSSSSWGLFHDHQQHEDKRMQEPYTTILHSSTAPAPPNPAVPGKETPRCLSTSVQQRAAPSDQGTVWCASVTLEYTPRAALGSVPTILIQDSTGGKFEHSQLSVHILSLHWLFSTSKSPPAISKSNTHFSSVCCRPSAASRF